MIFDGEQYIGVCHCALAAQRHEIIRALAAGNIAFQDAKKNREYKTEEEKKQTRK